ncbi:MAG: PIN domain-containing protein [Candidatus Njordarchaeales archaeon]
MGEVSYVIPRDLLMSLLNIAYYVYPKSGIRQGHIDVFTPPWSEESLFTIVLKKNIVEVTINVRSDQYERYISMRYDALVRRKDHDPEITKKIFKTAIPSPGIIRDALCFSGIALPRNWDELLRVLNEFCRREVHRGEEPGFIAFDTSVLRRGLVLHILDYVRRKRCKINYLLLKGVMSELSDNFKDVKYSREELKVLSDNLLYGAKAEQIFTNQLILDSRLWLEALQDYLMLKNEPTSQEIESEKGDDAFISAISNFRREKLADVLLVTMDNVFGSKAVAKGIRTVVLDDYPIPELFDRTYETTWEKAALLLYYLAIIYGTVTLHILGEHKMMRAYIYGIWRGKRKADWDTRSIKIETSDKLLIDKLNKLLKPLVI